MYIKKSLENKNLANPRPKLASFKDRIESFSKKAIVASMIIGSTVAPIQALSPQGMIISKGKVVAQKEHSIPPSEKKSLLYFVSALGLLASAYGVGIYLKTRKEIKDAKNGMNRTD